MTIDQLGQVSITCPTKSEHWHGLVAESTEKARRAMRTFVGFPVTDAVVLAPIVG